MLRRPHSSPLYPYTTLFRSHEQFPASQSVRRDPLPVQLDRLPEDARSGQTSPALLPEASGTRRRRHRRTVVLDDEDRKSTRLNSSHQIISYAVFCLKKKNYT